MTRHGRGFHNTWNQVGFVVKSMTGYGSSLGQSAQVELEINIKAINGRFLDLRFHIPKEYAHLESELKKEAIRFCQRGTLDIYINRRQGPEAKPMKITVHKAQAQEWHKTIKALAKDIGIKGEWQWRDLLQLPHVFDVDERHELSAPERKLLLKEFSRALQACDQERAREGEAIAKELTQLLDQLGTVVERITQERQQAEIETKKRWQTRLKSEEFQGLDPDRALSEALVQLERSDIREEIMRLKEHVQSFFSLVKTRKVQGKKLDFYCQELLRETNTIGSKSQWAPLTQQVIEAKMLIEQVREQVQNIE